MYMYIFFRYLITEPLLSAAFYSTSNTVLGNSIRFYTGNYKDVSKIYK